MIGYEYSVIPAPVRRINVALMKPTYAVNRILF